MTDHISEALSEAHSTISKFLEDDSKVSQIRSAIDILIEAFKSDGSVISCGNGGSMCDAMHFAEELTGRYRKNRPALRATAISDPSHISCVANDFGYEYIFSRYVEAWGNRGDVLLCISTSGNSKNVIEAVSAAKELGLKTIALLGKDGGQLKDLVDIPIIVEAHVADRVQEVHIKIIHIMIEGIERKLFPENY